MNMQNPGAGSAIPDEKRQDPSVIISISMDKSHAFAELNPPLDGSRGPSADEIISALKQAGVEGGIKNDVVRELAKQPRYKTSVLVAEVSHAVDGKDARLIFSFNAGGGNKPKENADGTVNFKELGLIHNVRRGDVLCVKDPPTSGVDGVKLSGERIPAKNGKDMPLPQGKNTYSSPDGLTLLSAADGQVDVVNKRITVQNSYEIDGDVDVATGNIDFVGNVTVRGNIIQGYSVKAEGNVYVRGCVDGGIIKAGGNVVIEQGYFGRLSGRIDCGGDLICKFVQNGEAYAEANFQAEMCMNANIRCGGNAKIIGAKSVIISSKISARHSIDCVNVGTPAAEKSVLEVGSDPQTMERFKAIPKEQEEINKKLSDVERLIVLFKKLEQANRLDEDKKKDLERLEFTKRSLTEMVVKLSLERAEVEQKLVTFGFGNINIRGTAHQGTVIIVGSETKTLDSSYTGMMFSRTEEGIRVDPANFR